MPAPSITPEERQDIRNKITNAMLAGWLKNEIIAQLSREYPTLKRDTAVKYHDEIVDEIARTAEDYAEHRLRNLGLAESRLQFMYRKAIEKGDIPTAVKVHTELMKLQGVYPGSAESRKAMQTLITGNTITVNNQRPKAIEDMSDQELALQAGVPLIMTVEQANKYIEVDDEP